MFAYSLPPVGSQLNPPKVRKSRIVTVRSHAGNDHHHQHPHQPKQHDELNRRVMLGVALGCAAIPVSNADAITSNPFEYKKALASRRRKIPIEEYSDGPDGLKYYDLEKGTGMLAEVGQRVAIHYDVKWRSITFMTSRQGMGVTGGTPLGFDVGTPAGTAGSTLTGIDLGVRGMRVGGLRKLLIPPNLAYGDKGIGEIPPNATLEVDLELLSIKTSPFGFQVKLVEG